MQTAESTISIFRNQHIERARYGALVLCLLALGALYWNTFVSLVGIWLTSDMFAHGFLIGPIALYLIYERRALIAQYSARVSWFGLAGIVGAGICWWVAFVADVQVIQQLAVVAMIPCLVLLILGRQVTWQIAFPLGFLFLAVPFGEAMTPGLIDLTADFVVSALRWSGIPVFREGTHFVIPSGRWSVVSGCSGMRYLMATVTVGMLFAYLNYTTILRRIIFVVLAIVVSIVANWLRAYGIVMIAHHSGMKLALGIDHYIYGWVFFGIVIFALMAIGRIWQEDTALPEEGDTQAAPRQNDDREVFSRVGLALALGIALLLVWPMLGSYTLSNSNVAPRIPQNFDAELPVNWTMSDTPLSDWLPEFHGETKLLSMTFDTTNDPIGLFLAWYSKQEQGAEVVSAKNRLIYEKHERWHQKRLGSRGIDEVPGVESVNEFEMASVDNTLLIWQWYWTGGNTTTTPNIAKLHQIISQLSGNGSAGASIIIYASITDEDYDAARNGLRKFIKAYNPVLKQSLNDANTR